MLTMSPTVSGPSHATCPAGWTNALFIKHGAAAVQLYPYGWRLPGGAAIRGFNYREIVLANECSYLQWFSPHAHLAFVRREDFPKKLRCVQCSAVRGNGRGPGDCLCVGGVCRGSKATEQGVGRAWLWHEDGLWVQGWGRGGRGVAEQEADGRHLVLCGSRPLGLGGALLSMS